MTLKLFEGYGIELEYMIVGDPSLDALPVADRVLESAAGELTGDVDFDATSWSNELVLHVIELKTNGPAAALEPLPEVFQRDVHRINEILSPLGGRLLPTAMHPWFDPARETKLWPHDNNAVYERFHRIFDCRGHGWSNLQSMHLNLPFDGDEELGRLHAAIRTVLPLLPALAASSPLVARRATGILDNRLAYYRINSRRIPSMTGRVIPEAVFTRADYEREILEKIYRDLEPHDPDGILRFEWANARGAIARFDRSAIEIRVLDLQECPLADLAIAAATCAIIRGLVLERSASMARQAALPTEALHAIFLATLVEGESAIVSDRELLDVLGFPLATRCTAGELWTHLIEAAFSSGLLTEQWRQPLEIILREGTLARRILHAVGHDLRAERIAEVYGELARCLASGQPFRR